MKLSCKTWSDEQGGWDERETEVMALPRVGEYLAFPGEGGGVLFVRVGLVIHDFTDDVVEAMVYAVPVPDIEQVIMQVYSERPNQPT